MRERSIDDYLKTIFLLGDEHVKSVDVAKKLNITKATVSTMVKKLVNAGLVISKRYGTIQLTESGRAHALKITHSFRVICDFLEEVLGFKKSDAIDQAHDLEHAFSLEGIQKLEEFLQKCNNCPYAKEMSKKKNLLGKNEFLLSELDIGKTAIVTRINGKGSFRRRLLEMGMIRGASVSIEKFAPLGDPIEIKVMGYHLSIRKSEATKILVRASS